RRALQLDQRGNVIAPVPIVGIEKRNGFKASGGGGQGADAPREIAIVGMRVGQDKMFRDPASDGLVGEAIGYEEMGARMRLSRDGLEALVQNFVCLAKIGRDDRYPHRLAPYSRMALAACKMSGSSAIEGPYAGARGPTRKARSSRDNMALE